MKKKQNIVEMWCCVCRRSVQFTAALLPGSSRDFTVAPSSGFLPPVGSAGKLISVSFTPTSALSEHRARLTIQVLTASVLRSPRFCFNAFIFSYFITDSNLPLVLFRWGNYRIFQIISRSRG